MMMRARYAATRLRHKLECKIFLFDPSTVLSNSLHAMHDSQFRIRNAIRTHLQGEFFSLQFSLMLR